MKNLSAITSISKTLSLDKIFCVILLVALLYPSIETTGSPLFLTVPQPEKIILSETDTVFGNFTEVTPQDSIFVTPAEDDFWVISTAPADYDNDGDLDIAVLGYYVVYNSSVEFKLQLLRNDGPEGNQSWNFTYFDVPLNGMSTGSSDMAWGDADSDGDLDLVVGSNNKTALYINNNGTLTQSGTVLPGYWEYNDQAEFDLQSITWSDFDNDGDADLLIPSVYDQETFSFHTALLRNDGYDSLNTIIFTETNSVFDGTSHAQSLWADFDLDQDMDLLLINVAPTFGDSFIKRYANNGNGEFTSDSPLGELNLQHGEARWGDFDNDGDLDILIAGGVNEPDGTYNHLVVRIYQNENEVYTPLEVVSNPTAEGWIDISAATWADYDSDGDMDILVAGNYNSGIEIEGRARIYTNNNGSFGDSGTALPAPRASGDRGGTFSWLDIDNDADLDYFIAGQYFTPGGNGLVEAQMHLYRNDATVQNAAPAIPAGLMATNPSQGVVKLEWNPTNDDHTPSSAITYNLVVYKNDSPVIVTSSLPEPGNVSNSTQWTITNLADGDYIWSLMALDASFTASVAATGSFTAGTVHTDLRNTSERGYSIGSIYPNPCIDQCRVSVAIPETCRVTITISDISGKKILPVTTSVYNAGTHEVIIDCSHLLPGIYQYKVEAGNFSKVQKLVVNTR